MHLLVLLTDFANLLVDPIAVLAQALGKLFTGILALDFHKGLAV